MRAIKWLFIPVFLLFCYSAEAQKKRKNKLTPAPKQVLEHADRNYIASIKSVSFFNQEDEQSLPLLYLGVPGQLRLNFDDLRATHRNLYFSIEHCTPQWEKSNLSPLEYVSGYGEEQIREANLSHNTLQPYVHYALSFPTKNTTPLLSGNYLLKVYEDGDAERLLLTRRFYVVEEKVGILSTPARNQTIQERNTHQRLEIELHTQGLSVDNPAQDLSVVILQNSRPDTQRWSKKPSGIRNNSLVFANPKDFNFPAGQEFITLDLRSLRLESFSVKSLTKDSVYRVKLWQDDYLDRQVYQHEKDENGRFYIRNLDFQENPDLFSEYALVEFSLAAAPEAGPIYLIGKATNYEHSEEFKLAYDEDLNTWKTELYLKQGVYDYAYTSPDSPNFFETENQYQIFVYYKNPRLTRSELIGFQQITLPL